jgi:hypothetical protein
MSAVQRDNLISDDGAKMLQKALEVNNIVQMPSIESVDLNGKKFYLDSEEIHGGGQLGNDLEDYGCYLFCKRLRAGEFKVLRELDLVSLLWYFSCAGFALVLLLRRVRVADVCGAG